MLIKKKSVMVVLLLGFVVLFFSILADQQVEGQSKIQIYTSIYPLHDLASRIVGDKFELELVVPNGVEIHGYEPSPRKIASLEKADLFFYIGLGLESWAEKVVQNLEEAGVKTVRVTKDLKLLELEEHDHSNCNCHEHHGHEHHDHEHHGHTYDPHVWLDPFNMKEIAYLITEELIRLDQGNQEFYRANYRDYAAEIEQLDREFKEGLAEKKREYVLVSHSAFGYLGKRYGFKQLSVTGISPDQEPTPGSLARLIGEVKEHNLEYIFLETLASPKTVDVLADEADLQVLELNPVAGLTAEDIAGGEDYFSLMRKNLANLKKALVE